MNERPGDAARRAMQLVTCALCNRAVGVLWLRGRSELVDWVRTEGDQVVVTIHRCRTTGPAVHLRRKGERTS